MKRTGPSITLLAAAVVLLCAARPAGAQYRRAGGPVGFTLNIGYMNINSQPRWVTVGPELELRLGRVLSLNPDVSIWFRDSFGGSVYLVPGATVNFRLKHFFFGGGAVRRISYWEDQVNGAFVPKVHAGLTTGPARLSAVLLFLGRTDTFVLGLNLGFGF
jgi:hypothetical protein